MKRFLWLGFVLFLDLICTGCGDTFRPIIIPNPPTFPNPAAAHTVVAINDNGTAVAGSAVVIDVSGDSTASVADCSTPLCLGIAPVHAVQQTSGQVLVVNHSDSISKVTFSGISMSSTTTIGLPPGSGPTFVAVAPNQTTAYVTLPNYVPDPVHNPGVVVPSVGVVSTVSNNMATTIPLSSNPGANPVALAVTPNNSKLYVANNGDSTISGFNTVGPSERSGSPVHTSSPPIWLVARTDNQRVYALEESTGVLAELDITATAGPDLLTEYPSTYSVPGATTMVYDSNKNRLYIPGGPVMKVIDISQTPAQVLATIAIPSVPGVPAVPANAVAVTALPDGSSAYVASVPAAQSSQVGVSGILGDGTTATYTYTLTGGHDLTPGLTVVVSGIAPPNDGFNGTFVVESVSNAVPGTTCDQPAAACTFQTANATTVAQTAVTGVASSTVDNLFPQVSVLNVASNFVTKTIGLPGVPDATNPNTAYYVPVCASTRFRFMMAAGGDSSRAYLSSCDGGNVDIIDTSNNTYIENLTAPASSRLNNPPQNPVFLFAGP
jgi:DNA-binding beta-propeller fold protein YncE